MVFFLFSCSLLPGWSQTNTYILNGSATQNSCNCYTLTTETNTQSGSVWNATKINLNTSFDFIFNVFLGCKDTTGADGIVFILQPISTSVGTSGEGMGFQGVAPSVGISLDTYQNTNQNDPDYDHISIQLNGMIQHGNDLAGPYHATPLSSNIEDCRWHTFRIVWDAATKKITTFLDGLQSLEATYDFVANVFGGNPMVYWGFSAGTGGLNNLQRFCTGLNPDFSTGSVANTVCIGEPVVFTNTSQSFSTILSYYWDFGDGTFSTLQNPPPHLYTFPGVYNVKMAITAMDGCNSDTLRKTVTVADYPVATFSIRDTCFGAAPVLTENSTTVIGNISRWNWTLDGQPFSTDRVPVLTGLSTGLHQLALTVQNNNGCISNPLAKPVSVLPSPVISAAGADGCVDIPVLFSAQKTDNNTTLAGWYWDFGDGGSSLIQQPAHVFRNTGSYTTKVYAMAQNGCPSNIISLAVVINKANAFAGNDTMVLENVPFQLQGSGGGLYNWSPATGLNNTAIAAPVATLQDDIRYVLKIMTPEGCVDEDDVQIRVFKGSAIYVPSAFTPNGDGRNDQLIPYCIGIKELSYFTLFNRWGYAVYSTRTIGEGWDGTKQGQPLDNGVYVWMLRAVDFAGKIYQLKGTTTILR